MKVAVCIAFCLFFACFANAQGSSDSSVPEEITTYSNASEYQRLLIGQMSQHLVRVLSLETENVTKTPFIFSAYDGSDSPNNTGCFEVDMNALIENNETQEVEGVRYRIELRKVFEFNDTNGDGLFSADETELSSIFTWATAADNNRSLTCDNFTSESVPSSDTGSDSTENIGAQLKDFVNCTLVVSNTNFTVELVILLPSKIAQGNLDPTTGEMKIPLDQFNSSSSDNSSSSEDSFWLLPSSIRMNLKIVSLKHVQGSSIGVMFAIKSIDNAVLSESSPDNFTKLSNKSITFDKGGFFSWNETALVGGQEIQGFAAQNLTEESDTDPSKNVDKGRIADEKTKLFVIAFKSEQISQDSPLLWGANLGLDPESFVSSESS